MANDIEDVATRVQRIETDMERLNTKVDNLSDRFDRRSEQVDRRFDDIRQQFDDVSAALVEQRQYTEFAYTRLDAKMDAGFGRVERKLDYLIDLNRRPRTRKRRR